MNMNRRNFLKVAGATVGVAALGVPATEAVAVDEVVRVAQPVPEMTDYYEQRFGDHWHYVRIGTVYNWIYNRDGLYANGTGFELPDFDSPRDVRALASVILERGI